MRVFKFGGASVRDANSIKKVGEIIKQYTDQPLLVVISAMGKTTNYLERIIFLSQNSKPYLNETDSVVSYHQKIANDLLSEPSKIAYAIQEFRNNISDGLRIKDHTYDQMYDLVVSQGEIISTQILFAYLAENGLSTEWIDARQFIKTDSTFREAKVDWIESEIRIQELRPLLENRILVTQGFIASSNSQYPTTLGREGSDFSAAIFASCLGAESVTIWKDVPGVMSADPKRLPDATTFEELPFKEAAEMTYYGASVIHPKTIKPLANKGIPLFVKNFDDVTLPGTQIHECTVDNLPPLIVFKDDQCLISCQVTDYTFIEESQIGIIFNALSSKGLKVNLIQNSAISFSFCVDFREDKVIALIKELGKHFEVYYN
ncbi:MAG: aspartate kinase, partial [Cyclobacteriaceae bacterium]